MRSFASAEGLVMVGFFGSRARRVACGIVLSLGVAIFGGTASADSGWGERWIEAKDGTKAEAFDAVGADKDTKKPVVLMLHGMCDAPENECPWFRDAARDVGFLACPRAPLSCGGGGFYWNAARAVKDAAVLGTDDAVRDTFGESVAPVGDDVIVGFSQGAYVAIDLAMRTPGRFSGLVLIAAQVKPDAQKLKDAGIRRVWLGSGDFDGAKQSMMHTATMLAREGITAKFVSTGKVGHTFPRDMTEKMREAIAWVRDKDESGS